MNARLASILAAWLGIGAAAAFFTWNFELRPGAAPAVDVALPSYGWALLLALAASGIAVALGSALGQVAWMARASYASCLLYAGFLATLGWPWLPWLLIAAAIALLVALKRRNFSRAGIELLLLHGMGTLGALYACFQLPTFLAAWPAFREVAGALWLVLTSVGS
jgi:hypothetical protein